MEKTIEIAGEQVPMSLVKKLLEETVRFVRDNNEEISSAVEALEAQYEQIRSV